MSTLIAHFVQAGALAKKPIEKRARVLVLYLATTILSCGTASAGDYFELKSFRWSADADPGLSITVTNEVGDIRIRNSKRGGFGVSAMIQSLDENQIEPNIDIKASSDASAYQVSVAGIFNGRVDLTLLIPNGSSVKANTTYGNLYCRINGDVDARTINGDLSVTSSGTVKGMTTTGSVNVWVKAPNWIEAHEIQTSSGDITFKVLTAYTFNLEVATKGRIDLYRHHDSTKPIYETRDNMSWLQGMDENEIDIKSENGDISVHATNLLEAVESGSTDARATPKDLLLLPRSQEWTPGQPIKEIPKN